MECVATIALAHFPLAEVGWPAVNLRLTFPNDPVPNVLSMIYCPILGFVPPDRDVLALPDVRALWPGAGGAGRVAISSSSRMGRATVVG